MFAFCLQVSPSEALSGTSRDEPTLPSLAGPGFPREFGRGGWNPARLDPGPEVGGGRGGTRTTPSGSNASQPGEEEKRAAGATVDVGRAQGWRRARQRVLRRPGRGWLGPASLPACRPCFATLVCGQGAGQGKGRPQAGVTPPPPCLSLSRSPCLAPPLEGAGAAPSVQCVSSPRAARRTRRLHPTPTARAWPGRGSREAARPRGVSQSSAPPLSLPAPAVPPGRGAIGWAAAPRRVARSWPRRHGPAPCPPAHSR